MQFFRGKGLWKWAVAGVVLAGLAMASRSLPLGEWMSRFTDWVKGQGTLGIVIFVVSYVIGTILFCPASLFSLAAGIAFGFWRGVPIALCGAALGAAASFLISRHLARDLVEKRLAGNEKLKAFDAAVAQEGWKVVFLFRLVPLFPFPVGNYFFGLTKVRFWPFLCATTVGIIPGSAFYVYLGYAGKIALGESRQARTTQEWVFLGLGLLATIGALFYVTRLARKSLRGIEDKARRQADS